MIGYIVAGIVGLILVIVFVVGLARSKPQEGATHGGAGRPVQNSSPAADEPTPDQSVTASSAEVRAAKRHTPPA